MKRKTLVLLIIPASAILTFLAIFYYIYNQPHTNYVTAEPDHRLNTPMELYHAFLEDETLASTTYNGKMIEFAGIPDFYEELDGKTIASFYLDEGDFGPQGIRCTFLKPIPTESQQGKIRLKGYCTGFNGIDIILENCSLITE
jgi:hypothetical protein